MSADDITAMHKAAITAHSSRPDLGSFSSGRDNEPFVDARMTDNIGHSASEKVPP